MMLLTHLPLHRKRLPRLGWIMPILLAIAMILVGHGCHGPDEDHELCVPFMPRLETPTSPPAGEPVGSALPAVALPTPPR